MAGAPTEQSLSRGEIARIVRDAGFTPVERDTLYHPLVREAPPPSAAAGPAVPAGAPPA
jgi:aminodeoxyfutalosine synthase